ncbi:Ataxin-10 [Anabarilius grahami]|uniref:Ataxin-10 n=1 Tax=Anabarilius grahami TaxID=495550 RepID=A0A3N0XF98_ANAGA|nr:Ataxin-10 [Anabarilius grahami]
MAASSDSMQNINSALCEIAEEKLTNTHLTTLQTVTKALRDEQFRNSADREALGNLYAVLSRLYVDFHHLTEEMDSQEEGSLCYKLTTECFRAHRNACVQCTQNQCCLRDLGSIKLSFEILAKLLKISSGGSNDIYDALRCGVQFLGNIAVGNQLCKDDIWELGFPHIFRDLLELPDEKAVSYTCMVIHTCLDEHKTQQLVKDTQQLKLSLKIMDLCRTLPDVDWTIFIATQHFLKSSELIRKMYTEMTNDARLTLLELILAQLGVVEEEKDCLMPLSVAQFLASCFTDHCRAVLTLSSESSDDQAAMVVIRLLDILCEMTSDCKEFMALQDHAGLLSATVDLLKEVHLLGKTSKNVFTAAHDFSLTRPGGADTHPAFGFKAQLIRLIGNLCHGHIINQDKVRELDGIALILDNCSIDSNNPFISQWAVFAIRNILEHNLENQKLIQGLRRQGVADDTMLRDMGFRVEERDGNLLLRPLKKDP